MKIKGKLQLIERAIDAIIDVAELEEIDYHEFVDSCNSIVSKLRDAEYKITNS